jgi:hypothetical protein
MRVARVGHKRGVTEQRCWRHRWRR